jgi:amino acid transporter
MAFSLKRILIGNPVSTEHAQHERLPKVTALAVFASDALSSTAYATQEIMLALMLTVAFAANPSTLDNLNNILPIGLGIAVLLIIVATSYRQTIYAYPGGGGAYLVAKENLGQTTGLVAAAALLIDYVLTVAVSIAAGIAALTSALPILRGHPVELCFLAISFITLLNLRGMKESGTAFAIPTYGFVASMAILISYGLFQHFSGATMFYEPLQKQLASNISVVNEHPEQLGLFMLLRAFASGCTALTGVEAISDGVPAFKKPEAKNAAITLGWMATILTTMFLGITYLAYATKAQPIVALDKHTNHVAVHHGHLEEPTETLVSVMAHMVFDGGPLAWFYYVLQFATAMILILAANTAYADFPRLSSILAKDRFMPRQFQSIGDRLVFNNGIIALAIFSFALIWAFKGSTTRLIALYAVGVFTSFTLSQLGMVVHWFKYKIPRWQLAATVNAVGATATCIVAIIITYTKFTSGAYMVIAAIPFLVFVLRSINNHYRSVSKQLSMEGYRPAQGVRQHVLVLVPDIHRGVIPALQLGRSMSTDTRAIHVSIDPNREARVKERWTLYSRGMPLTILQSPFRSLVDPVVEHVQELRKRDPQGMVIIIIPEFEPRGWWPKFLHGHAGLALAVKLHFIPGVVVVNVPYHIEAFVRNKEDEPNNPGKQIGGCANDPLSGTKN